MDSVQRLRAIAQQTGTLKSTPQQKVIVTPAAPVSAAARQQRQPPRRRLRPRRSLK
jgi:hypothetical protein